MIEYKLNSSRHIAMQTDIIRGCLLFFLIHIYVIYSLSCFFLKPIISLEFTYLVLSARETLPTWDKQIQSLCYQVNQIIEKIAQTEPEWIAKAMEDQMVH